MYDLFLARTAAPPVFLSAGFVMPWRSAGRMAAGPGAAATEDKAGVLPRGSDVASPFYGVTHLSLRKGVPPDLVTAPVEHEDPLIKCSAASSSSKRPRRSSVYDGGVVLATSSMVAYVSYYPFPSESSPEDTSTG